MGGLRQFVEEKMELLEKAIEQCFACMEQPLQAGVQVARASYRRILGTCLVVSGLFFSSARSTLSPNASDTITLLSRRS